MSRSGPLAPRLLTKGVTLARRSPPLAAGTCMRLVVGLNECGQTSAAMLCFFDYDCRLWTQVQSAMTK
jgi:hypothetical protein